MEATEFAVMMRSINELFQVQGLLNGLNPQIAAQLVQNPALRIACKSNRIFDQAYMRYHAAIKKAGRSGKVRALALLHY